MNSFRQRECATPDPLPTYVTSPDSGNYTNLADCSSNGAPAGKGDAAASPFSRSISRLFRRMSPALRRKMENRRSTSLNSGLQRTYNYSPASTIDSKAKPQRSLRGRRESATRPRPFSFRRWFRSRHEAGEPISPWSPDGPENSFSSVGAPSSVRSFPNGKLPWEDDREALSRTSPESHQVSDYNFNESDLIDTSPAKKPSYINISCVLNGYKSPSKTSSGSGTSLCKLRLLAPEAKNSEISDFFQQDDESDISTKPNSNADTPEQTPRVLMERVQNGLRPAQQNGDDVKLKKPESQPSSAERVISPERPTSTLTAHDYIALVDSTKTRLLAQMVQCEDYLANNAPLHADCEGQLQSFVGKARLLCNNKLQTCLHLCDRNLYPDRFEGELPAKIGDLTGYWELISIELDDLARSLSLIERMREAGWEPVAQERKVTPKATPRGVRKKTTQTAAAKSQFAKFRKDLQAKQENENSDSSVEMNDNGQMFIVA